MKKVLVIGGGAAGMMAACKAAEEGSQVDLYDKNEKLGKKIYITGKGRCNLTNDCEPEDWFDSICTNPRFMYSSFSALNNKEVIRFFENHGMPVKVERGQRAFPVSDHASDVIQTLAGAMHDAGVHVHLNTAVDSLLTEETRIQAEAGAEKKKEAQTKIIKGVRLADGTEVAADAVIVCTGGLSYPSTGSTGDGYRFARECGLKVTDCSPSLVPLNAQEEDIKSMQGLSLRNVRMWISDGKKTLYDDFGEMMFTHFGVTGPLVLSASTVIQKQLKKHPLSMHIDLKPVLTDQQLDARFLREFDAGKNKHFRNILGNLYPAKMIPVIIARSGISEDIEVNTVTKQQRQSLVRLTKDFALTITSLRGYNEAIVTRGGVNVRQIDPATMESRLVRNLYFAGEILDVDGVTGGFNLQIAWSTGAAAGSAAAR